MNTLEYYENISCGVKSVESLGEDNKNISGGSKKTSVLLPLDLIQLIEGSPMNQTQTIVAALKFYFSEDRQKISEYPQIILGYERKITEYEKSIAVLEAKVGELDFIKQEFTRLHDLLDEQRNLSKGHMAQVQSLIEERKNQDYLIRQKEEKILQLEEAKSIIGKTTSKKKWYKFWK